MQLVNHAQADMSLSRFGLCYWTKSILLSFCQLGPKEPPLQPSQPDEEEDEEEDANVNSPHQTESELNTDWVARTRPEIWKPVSGRPNNKSRPFWCLICHREIKTYRLRDRKYFLLHELTKKHRDNLKKSEGDSADSAMAAEAAEVPCHGVPVGHAEFPISKLQQSCRNWFSQGMPNFACHEEERQKEFSLLPAPGEDSLRCRSALCSATVTDGSAACRSCCKVARKKSTMEDIASWSFKAGSFLH